MINQKDITFVITTYRSRKTIMGCIESIPDEINKIVVENSNDYELKLLLEKNYSNLICHVMEKNVGYGKANNYGIGQSNTKYIFILNPDVILPKNFIENFLKILDNELFSIAAPIEQNDNIINKFNKKGIANVKEVKGFALLLNKNMIKNFFDENFFLYLEEIDLCRRVINFGGRIILANLRVTHFGGNSHGNKYDFEMEKSRNWHWMWSKFYFNKKYNGYLLSFIKTLPIFVSTFIKFIFYKLRNQNEKKIIYYMRMMGLLNSYLLRSSFYRPYE